MHSRSLVAALLVTLLAVVSAFGQVGQLDNPVGQDVPYQYDSGRHDNPMPGYAMVAQTVVHVKDVAWIRVYFSELNLDGSSFLRVVSVRDGDMQEFDAGLAHMWSKTTAYFNGDALALELWAAPGSIANRVAIDHLAVETLAIPAGGAGQCGICGGVDNRTPTTLDRVCRIMPVGCTATIYCRSSAMVTAGHCLGGTPVVQFRVPNSLANCNTVNPPAAEQFPVVGQSGTGSGVGNDYGVMNVGTNTLGQTPYHRYNVLVPIGATPANGNPITFNGYGLDLTCTRSQTQQLSTGNVTALLANSFQYNNDVRGGNSGSGVISAAETIVGIVTHCQTNCPPNHAQRMDRAGFVTARNTLAGVCNGVLRLVDVQATGAASPTITVSVADVNALTSGAANFKRVYTNGASVNFTAPATSGGACFQRWTLNGLPSFANPIAVTMNADHVLVAEYGSCAPPVPPNNLCLTAFDVSGGGTFNGTLVGATNDGAADCGTSATNPDVWYTFTAPNFHTRLFVDTCGTNDTGGLDQGVDTVVSLHTSCGGSQIVCNDDRTATSGPSCGTLDQGLIRDSSIEIVLNPLQTVKIRVSKFSAGIIGPFVLHVSSQVANDACPNAINVSAGGSFPGTLVTATNDGTATCGTSGTNPDVWYSFTAPSVATTLIVDTCGSNDTTGIDAVMSILTACGGTELACNDDRLPTSGPSCGTLDGGLIRDPSIEIALAASQSVRIRVSKFSTLPLLPFTLRVQSSPIGATCDADFNCDGNTDQDDVACMVAVIAGNPACGCQDPDFNHDGNVDQDDVAALINVVAGGSCP